MFYNTTDIDKSIAASAIDITASLCDITLMAAILFLAIRCAETMMWIYVQGCNVFPVWCVYWTHISPPPSEVSNCWLPRQRQRNAKQSPKNIHSPFSLFSIRRAASSPPSRSTPSKQVNKPTCHYTSPPSCETLEITTIVEDVLKTRDRRKPRVHFGSKDGITTVMQHPRVDPGLNANEGDQYNEFGGLQPQAATDLATPQLHLIKSACYSESIV